MESTERGQVEALFAELPPLATCEPAAVPPGTPRLLRPNRQQIEMRPIDLDSVLSPDHRARVVWAFTEGLDLRELRAPIKAIEGHAGHPAIDPQILLAVWLYATSEGIGAARAVDRRCGSDDAYRWLLGGVSVNYHTLSDFRRDHEAVLDRLLTESLAVMLDAGLVRLERVAQDGMRVRASAGAASFRREPSLRRCLAAAEEHVARLKEDLDGPEEERPARQQAAQTRAAREQQERVARALAQLPAVRAAKEPGQEGDARVSTTDPEARVMKMADGGFRPALNVQFGTDTASQVIVHVDVVNIGSDATQLAAGLDQIETRTGHLPGAALVDGGFSTKANIEPAERRGVAVYAPVKPPKGQNRDRYEPRSTDSAEMAAWRARMATDEAAAVYRERAAAECVNALARLRGLSRFWVRGLRTARCVALLVALTHNLFRQHALLAARTAAAA